MPFIDYRLNLAELSFSNGLGEIIIEDVLNEIGTFQDANLEFGFDLNEEGFLNFSLPIDHPLVTRDNFKNGAREIHLYRNDVLTWGGKLWKTEFRDWEVRFLCYGWLHDLNEKRIVGSNGIDYVTLLRDQSLIVKDLIDATQAMPNGHLGLITSGITATGVERKLVVCVEERAYVGDVINDLMAAKNGFDIEIAPDKTVNIYSPRKGVATNIAFTGENMTTFGLDEDATEIVNSAGILGPEADCAMPSLFVTEDSVSKNVYGLMEGTLDDIWTKKADDQSWREQIAEEKIRIDSAPRFQPSVSWMTELQDTTIDNVEFTELHVGDVVTVESDRGAPGGFGYFNQAFRIIGIDVAASTPGIEAVTVKLDQTVGD